MSDIKVYTLTEAIQILKVTRRTFYRYIQGGQVKVFKLGREYRITEEALQDFMSRGTDKNYLAFTRSKKG